MSVLARRLCLHLCFLVVLVIPLTAVGLDVSGMYTATVNSTSLALTLTQQGTSVAGSMQVSGTDCFSSLTFAGTLGGSTLTGTFTDQVSSIFVRLTVSSNKLAGTYSITAGSCKGDNGNVTFTRVAVPPTPTPTATPTVFCAGDCDGNGLVTVTELVTLATIELGHENSSACPSGVPGDGRVDVALVVNAVNNLLEGSCPP